jgi:hypothetical protein
MEKSFLQKRGFGFRKFTLQNTTITVESKSLQNHAKYEVEIDKLGLETHYFKENTLPGKIFFGIILISILAVTVAEIRLRDMNYGQIAAIYFCAGALLFLSFLKELKDDIYLTGGEKNLIFYRNKPSEEKVLAFIEVIKEAIKTRLKLKYLSGENYLNKEDYLSTLYWLRDIKIISDNELENYINDYEVKRLL